MFILFFNFNFFLDAFVRFFNGLVTKMNTFSYILNPNPYLSYRPKEIQANECLCKVVVHRPSKYQKIYTNKIL